MNTTPADPRNLRVSYYKGYPKKGDSITVTTLYDVLFSNPGLENLDPDKKKGNNDAIQFYVKDILDGTTDDTFTDGIIGIDIDKIAKEDCKTIYDNFNLLAQEYHGLLCCCFSSSYYNTEKTTGGLHLIVRTSKDKLYRDEYKEMNIVYSAVFAYLVFRRLGIDIRPRKMTDCETGLDSHLQSIAHRFFLNHSTVQWNDYASYMTIDKNLIVLVKDWFNEDYDNRKQWFETKSPFRTTKCEFKSIDLTTYNGCHVNLGFNGRINIINALHKWGFEDDAILRIVLSICGDSDWEGDRKCKGALERNVRQCISTAHTQNPTAEQLEKAKTLLESVGINVDLEIERVYDPLDVVSTIDKLFLDAWEKTKDEPYYNVHYNPRNFLKLNLKSNEFLTDYKHEINEMINNYEMTYLVADCMVGKTTYALNMQSEYGLFDDDFIVHFKGDSIDVCVPYNSVADNKAKGSRKDIKRVKTADLSKFSLDKRNVYIWNTVMPLYDEYFKLGIIKRMVLFFDESQKLVTDDYRWETVFEMFKVLPMMYRHFVFMTGTPAFELDYLKQYFKDYCIIKVDKEIDYKRECKILKYNKFGIGDRISLIEEVIASGRLPLIYSNSRNYDWKEACLKINKKRVECGLKPYRILDYSRPNTDRLGNVNKSNSIKDYDIVIATKYCSVGIDFQKDDKRMRCAIVDYAGEKECTFHDIWQFTLRNRNQDTITKIIVHNDERYGSKLKNHWYYESLFDEMARIHTYRTAKPSSWNEDDGTQWQFAQDVFQSRKFGKLVNDRNDYFADERNVKLLSVYYLYLKTFSNMNIIKHMLERRGVEITEVEMEHKTERMDYEKKKEIYKFFVDNFKEISQIDSYRGKYDNMSYQIDINDDSVENIADGKVNTRNKHYMDWLIAQFAGKDEWYDILKGQDYLTKETFATYNRMNLIANKMTRKEMDKIKRLGKHMNDSDLDDIVLELVDKHYSGALEFSRDDVRNAILLHDVIEDYRRIIRFAVENIDFIEEIKNAKDEYGRLTATHKMKIAIEQKENERARKKMSSAGKKHSKTITVRYKKNGKEKSFDSIEDFCSDFKCSKKTFYKITKNEKCKLSEVVELIDTE